MQRNQNQIEWKCSVGRQRGRSRVVGMIMKTCCSMAALLVVIFGMPLSSRADLPLVYDVENTGTNFPAPPLPTLANLPTIQPLPDPFAWANDPFGSTRSTNFSDWSHHRAEIKAQIENYEIGMKPAVDPTNIFASYTVITPTSGTLTVRVTNVVFGTNRTLTLTCAVALPSGSGPFAAIIGMNSPSGSIPSSLLTSRNIARITFSHNQVTTYGSQQNSDPYYQLYPNLNNNNTGQYSAWAWGVSRIVDGLYKTQGTLPINLQRIAVTGCSYAGKMALFAGALDERVVLTIPQESGGGGAPNWRYSWQNEPNGTVEGLGQTDHNWFSEGMFAFAGANTAKLPHDHHMLMAMVAPRALFAMGNPDYLWLSNPSCYVSCRAVEQIYSTWGISDRFGYNIVGGHAHCATTTSINNEIGAFLDKFLLGNTNVNTTIRDFASTYNSVNYTRWTQWWGTGNPVFPEISLQVPTQATEGNGTLTGLGSVSINGVTSTDLVVNLSSSDTSEVTVPPSVIIPPGQSNAVFDLTIVDDLLLDGDQAVTIVATNSLASNLPQAVIKVHDNETTTLSVTLPASASESAGTLFGGGSVSMGAPAAKNITVSLSSSAPSSLALLPTTVIPTGQTSAVFNLTFANNNVLEPPKNVTVTAHVQNWTDGSASITILDDDPPDHFTLSLIPSPQLVGEPFSVTVTAKNSANNTVGYESSAALSALVPGNDTATNTILGSPGADQSLPDDPAERVCGYSFTPNANLKVTHVRHFFGDKVSVWTASGQLLASQNVVSVSGTWVDTPLPAPLILFSGETYVLAVHEIAVERFWSYTLPAIFPHGTINQSYLDSGDKFPTQIANVAWFYVDLLYATDVGSLPINPGATANFTNGNWSGDIAALQTGTNIVLQASAGVGHSGASGPFDVLGTPKLSIAAFSNSVVLSWPTAAAGFNLEKADTLPNWTNAPGTPAIVGDRYNVTNAIDATRVFYRLRKP
jgi:Glucuronyl esterase, fungi